MSDSDIAKQLQDELDYMEMRGPVRVCGDGVGPHHFALMNAALAEIERLRTGKSLEEMPPAERQE